MSALDIGIVGAEPLLTQIQDARQLLPASYFDVSLPRFHAPRLVFIGDAAHATSPQLGHGTNHALRKRACLRRVFPDVATWTRLSSASMKRGGATHIIAS